MTPLDAGFDPETPRHSYKRDSTLKTHGKAMVLHLLPCKRIKHIVVSWRTVVLHLVL